MEMPEDRMSFLPDELISCILSFLPMDSAVRTGILSKRWLNQWKLIDVIYFHQPEALMDYGSVDHCIHLLGDQKINKFVVVGSFGPLSESNICGWVDFAIAKQVHCLEFYMRVDVDDYTFDATMEWRDDYFKLPKSFYIGNTKSIENMALSRVDFFPPNPILGLSGYASLKKLFLFESRLPDEAIQSILSTCRVLESLSIVRCVGHNCAKYSSTSLKELVHVNGYVYDVDEIEIDTPNLVTLKGYEIVVFVTQFNGSCHPSEVRLYDPHDDNWLSAEGLLTNMSNVKSLLSHVKYFGTNLWFLLELITKHILGEYPHTMFEDLIEFHLASDCYSKSHMAILFKFLGKCPSLAKIQIEFDNLRGLGCKGKPKIFLAERKIYTPTNSVLKLDKEEEDVEKEDVVLMAGMLKKLKVIEFFHCRGAKYELEIAKPLLQKSPNLEKLVLLFDVPEHHVVRDFRYVVSDNRREEIKEKMSLLPRASISTKFILGDLPPACVPIQFKSYMGTLK